MKKTTLTLLIILTLSAGCTQIITAPISIASSTVSGTLDVVGSTVDIVTGKDDD